MMNVADERENLLNLTPKQLFYLATVLKLQKSVICRIEEANRLSQSAGVSQDLYRCLVEKFPAHYNLIPLSPDHSIRFSLMQSDSHLILASNLHPAYDRVSSAHRRFGEGVLRYREKTLSALLQNILRFQLLVDIQCNVNVSDFIAFQNPFYARSRSSDQKGGSFEGDSDQLWPPLRTGYTISAWFKIELPIKLNSEVCDIPSDMNLQYVLLEVKRVDGTGAISTFTLEVDKAMRLMASIGIRYPNEKETFQHIDFSELPAVSVGTWHHICFCHHTVQIGSATIQAPIQQVAIASLDGTMSCKKDFEYSVASANDTDDAVLNGNSSTARFGVRSNMGAATNLDLTTTPDKLNSPTSRDTILMFDIASVVVFNLAATFEQHLALFAAGPNFNGHDEHGMVAVEPKLCNSRLLAALVSVVHADWADVERDLAESVNSTIASNSNNANGSGSEKGKSTPSSAVKGAQWPAQIDLFKKLESALGIPPSRVMLSVSPRWNYAGAADADSMLRRVAPICLVRGMTQSRVMEAELSNRISLSSLNFNVCLAESELSNLGSNVTEELSDVKPILFANHGHPLLLPKASMKELRSVNQPCYTIQCFFALVSQLSHSGSVEAASAVLQLLGAALRDTPLMRRFLPSSQSHFLAFCLSHILELKALEGFFGGSTVSGLSDGILALVTDFSCWETGNALATVWKKLTVHYQSGPNLAQALASTDSTGSSPAYLSDSGLLRMMLANSSIWRCCSTSVFSSFLAGFRGLFVRPFGTLHGLNKTQLRRAHFARWLLMLLLDPFTPIEFFAPIVDCAEEMIAGDFFDLEDFHHFVRTFVAYTVTPPTSVTGDDAGNGTRRPSVRTLNSPISEGSGGGSSASGSNFGGGQSGSTSNMNETSKRSSSTGMAGIQGFIFNGILGGTGLGSKKSGAVSAAATVHKPDHLETIRRNPRRLRNVRLALAAVILQAANRFALIMPHAMAHGAVAAGVAAGEEEAGGARVDPSTGLRPDSVDSAGTTVSTTLTASTSGGGSAYGGAGKHQMSSAPTQSDSATESSPQIVFEYGTAEHPISITKDQHQQLTSLLMSVGSRGMSFLLTSLPLAQLVNILFQYADLVPTLVANGHGPLRPSHRRRDPEVGLLVLKILMVLLPFFPGGLSKMQWVKEIELYLPGLLLAMLIAPSAQDVAEAAENDQSLPTFLSLYPGWIERDQDDAVEDESDLVLNVAQKSNFYFQSASAAMRLGVEGIPSFCDKPPQQEKYEKRQDCQQEAQQQQRQVPLKRLLETVFDMLLGGPKRAENIFEALLAPWDVSANEPQFNAPDPKALSSVFHSSVPRGVDCSRIGVDCPQMLVLVLEVARSAAEKSTLEAFQLSQHAAVQSGRLAAKGGITDASRLAIATAGHRSANQLAITILCALSSLFHQSPLFRSQLKAAKMGGSGSGGSASAAKTYMDDLLAGIVQIFYSAAKANLVAVIMKGFFQLEETSPAASAAPASGQPPSGQSHAHSAERGGGGGGGGGDSYLDLEPDSEDWLAVPGDLVYRSCGSIIGRVCLQFVATVATQQLLEFTEITGATAAATTTEKSMKSPFSTSSSPEATVRPGDFSVNASWARALNAPPTPSYPSMPSAVAHLIAFCLNSAARRRIVSLCCTWIQSRYYETHLNAYYLVKNMDEGSTVNPFYAAQGKGSARSAQQSPHKGKITQSATPTVHDFCGELMVGVGELLKQMSELELGQAIDEDTVLANPQGRVVSSFYSVVKLVEDVRDAIGAIQDLQVGAAAAVAKAVAALQSSSDKSKEHKPAEPKRNMFSSLFKGKAAAAAAAATSQPDSAQAPSSPSSSGSANSGSFFGKIVTGVFGKKAVKEVDREFDQINTGISMALLATRRAVVTLIETHRYGDQQLAQKAIELLIAKRDVILGKDLHMQAFLKAFREGTMGDYKVPMGSPVAVAMGMAKAQKRKVGLAYWQWDEDFAAALSYELSSILLEDNERVRKSGFECWAALMTSPLLSMARSLLKLEKGLVEGLDVPVDLWAHQGCGFSVMMAMFNQAGSQDADNEALGSEHTGECDSVASLEEGAPAEMGPAPAGGLTHDGAVPVAGDLCTNHLDGDDQDIAGADDAGCADGVVSKAAVVESEVTDEAEGIESEIVGVAAGISPDIQFYAWFGTLPEPIRAALNDKLYTRSVAYRDKWVESISSERASDSSPLSAAMSGDSTDSSLGSTVTALGKNISFGLKAGFSVGMRVLGSPKAYDLPVVQLHRIRWERQSQEVEKMQTYLLNYLYKAHIPRRKDARSLQIAHRDWEKLYERQCTRLRLFSRKRWETLRRTIDNLNPSLLYIVKAGSNSSTSALQPLGAQPESASTAHPIAEPTAQSDVQRIEICRLGPDLPPPNLLMNGCIPGRGGGSGSGVGEGESPPPSPSPGRQRGSIASSNGGGDSSGSSRSSPWFRSALGLTLMGKLAGVDQDPRSVLTTAGPNVSASGNSSGGECDGERGGDGGSGSSNGGEADVGVNWYDVGIALADDLILAVEETEDDFGTREPGTDGTIMAVGALLRVEDKGEWGLSMEEGPGRTRRKIRRGNLVLLRVNDPTQGLLVRASLAKAKAKAKATDRAVQLSATVDERAELLDSSSASGASRNRNKRLVFQRTLEDSADSSDVIGESDADVAHLPDDAAAAEHEGKRVIESYPAVENESAVESGDEEEDSYGTIDFADGESAAGSSIRRRKSRSASASSLRSLNSGTSASGSEFSAGLDEDEEDDEGTIEGTMEGTLEGEDEEDEDYELANEGSVSSFGDEDRGLEDGVGDGDRDGDGVGGEEGYQYGLDADQQAGGSLSLGGSPGGKREGVAMVSSEAATQAAAGFRLKVPQDVGASGVGDAAAASPTAAELASPQEYFTPLEGAAATAAARDEARQLSPDLASRLLASSARPTPAGVSPGGSLGGSLGESPVGPSGVSVELQADGGDSVDPQALSHKDKAVAAGADIGGAGGAAAAAAGRNRSPSSPRVASPLRLDMTAEDQQDNSGGGGGGNRPPGRTPGTGMRRRESIMMVRERDRERSSITGPKVDIEAELLQQVLFPGERLKASALCEEVVGMDNCARYCFITSLRLYLATASADQPQPGLQQQQQQPLSPQSDSSRGPSRNARGFSGITAGFSSGEGQADSSRKIIGDRLLEVWLPRKSSRAKKSSGAPGSPTAGSSPGIGFITNYQIEVPSRGISSRSMRVWILPDITSIQRRRYLLVDRGVEIFFKTKHSSLLVFPTLQAREQFLAQLLPRCSPSAHPPLLLLPAPPSSGLSSLAPRGAGSSVGTVDPVTARWCEGGMTNFDYLMYLNTLAGRSTNDLTCYPVFPWVLMDYTSEHLDLGDPSVYRDLSKPMGAISKVREKAARERYNTLIDLQLMSAEMDEGGGFRGPGSGSGPKSPHRLTTAERLMSLGTGGEARAKAKALARAREIYAKQAYHYGTHYSTSAVVLYYMVRLQPFSSHSIALQVGRFDRPDRLFRSVRESWLSASGGVTADPSTATGGLQDVKELIPEFYYLPDFLCNMNGYEMGFAVQRDGSGSARSSTQQEDEEDPLGIRVAGVELPPWASGSPREFIRLHRAALESDFVSAHLHEWIDLIFGYKQRGSAAEQACNLFHYLTYSGSDPSSGSPSEGKSKGVKAKGAASSERDAFAAAHAKAAHEQQIRDFGQTPEQLFKQPHPQRKPRYGASSRVVRDVAGVSKALRARTRTTSAGSDAGLTIAPAAAGVAISMAKSLPSDPTIVAKGSNDSTAVISATADLALSRDSEDESAVVREDVGAATTDQDVGDAAASPMGGNGDGANAAPQTDIAIGPETDVALPVAVPAAATNPALEPASSSSSSSSSGTAAVAAATVSYKPTKGPVAASTGGSSCGVSAHGVPSASQHDSGHSQSGQSGPSSFALLSAMGLAPPEVVVAGFNSVMCTGESTHVCVVTVSDTLLKTVGVRPLLCKTPFHHLEKEKEKERGGEKENCGDKEIRRAGENEGEKVPDGNKEASEAMTTRFISKEFKSLNHRSIGEIRVISSSRDGVGDVVYGASAGCLLVPPYSDMMIATGFLNATLKLLEYDDDEWRIVNALDLDSSGIGGGGAGLASVCSAAAISEDGSLLLTALDPLAAIQIWRRTQDLQLAATTEHGVDASSGGSSVAMAMSSHGSGAGAGAGPGSAGGFSGSTSVPGEATVDDEVLRAFPYTLVEQMHADAFHGGATVVAVKICAAFNIFVTACAAGRAVLWDLLSFRGIELDLGLEPLGMITAESDAVAEQLLKELSSFELGDSTATPAADDASMGGLLGAMEAVGAAIPTRVWGIDIDIINGNIYIAHGSRVSIFDINGRRLVTADICAGAVSDCGDEAVQVLCVACCPVAEWVRERGFVVGCSDGSIRMWKSEVCVGDGDDEDDDVVEHGSDSAASVRSSLAETGRGSVGSDAAAPAATPGHNLGGSGAASPRRDLHVQEMSRLPYAFGGAAVTAVRVVPVGLHVAQGGVAMVLYAGSEEGTVSRWNLLHAE